MPAQSEKQARLFRLVRALQKGGIKPKEVSPQIRKMARTIKPSSVKHFTKLKEILKQLKENEYSLSKFKKVTNKSFNTLLRENVGIPFEEKELEIFQNKQNGFSGFGKVNFLHNKNTNEITTEVFSNSSTKNYVFKKLIDNKDQNVCKYGCFVEITYPDNPEKQKFYTLSSAFDNKDDNEKTKVLADFINRINSYGI